MIDDFKICLNCDRVVPIEDITEVGDLLECRGVDDYKDYSACTFDSLTKEEYERWLKK